MGKSVDYFPSFWEFYFCTKWLVYACMVTYHKPPIEMSTPLNDDLELAMMIGLSSYVCGL